MPENKIIEHLFLTSWKVKGVGLISLPLLLEGAALPSLSLGGVLDGATFPFSSVGWCRLASLFGWCCVWPSLLLRGAAFLLPLLVVLLSLSSSLGWCCLASFVERCCVVPSPFAWCRLPSPPSLGGLVSLPSSVGWCCPPSPPLGGDAFPPSSVGWCCLPSPPLGGAAFPLLFSWVVLLGLLRWVVLCYSLSFLRGATFLHHLLWAGLFQKEKSKK